MLQLIPLHSSHHQYMREQGFLGLETDAELAAVGGSAAGSRPIAADSEFTRRLSGRFNPRSSARARGSTSVGDVAD